MSQIELSLESKTILNNDISMPTLGLGTWNMHGKTMIQAINWALELGYRHFDTARYYKNEKELGEALNNSKYPRKNLFITSKVWPNDFGFNKSKKSFQASLDALGLDYIDQYLIHWPREKKKTHETWKALIEVYKQDKCKTIGVSNYSISDLEELKNISDIIPASNQIEFHPFKFDQEILDYCKSENIAVVSYSPLTQGRKMNNSVINKIALKYNKTYAQVLLRWGLQHGTVIIPKSSNKERLKENTLIYDFELSIDEMNELNSLNS
jgi:diketogulonate reductase-like aldo/keto reductase